MAVGFYFILFLMCIFCSLFFLFVAMQRERTDRRKRNMLYYGNASHCFIQNDAVKNRVFHLSASLSCYRTRSAFFKQTASLCKGGGTKWRWVLFQTIFKVFL